MDLKKPFNPSAGSGRGPSTWLRVNEMSILSPLLMTFTVVYLTLMIVDFAARGAYTLPSGLMGYYIALVGAYALDKEARRWMGKEEPPRAGSLFVYLWALFFLVAFVIHSFRSDFVVPEDLGKVALQVLGIFFGSKASKGIYESKNAAKPEVVLSREQTVIEMIKKNGKATRKEVLTALKISRSSAGRLLEGMEEKGMIKQVGADEKDTHYVLAGGN